MSKASLNSTLRLNNSQYKSRNKGVALQCSANPTSPLCRQPSACRCLGAQCPVPRRRGGGLTRQTYKITVICHDHIIFGMRKYDRDVNIMFLYILIPRNNYSIIHVIPSPSTTQPAHQIYKCQVSNKRLF